MSNPRNQDFVGNDRVEGEEIEDSSGIDSVSSSGVEASGVGPASRSEIGLTERLTDIFTEEGDGDLLFHGSDGEDRVLQWLQALDMQVMGACRSDERLKPFLKMNSSNGIAEDCLLAQLSQHFEPAEVGVLARCLCIPLVSIRVGKINKQGTLLCPTTVRGSLNLMVLPTSDFRLSFIGDDGHVERLFTLKSSSQCVAVVVNEISADNSGRSFVIKIPNDRVFYFWCSEKSKLLGIEMLTKMKDILKRKPSISDLTGISESRLGCFATQLRSYLVGFTSATNQANAGGCSPPIETTTELSGTAYSEKLPSIPSTQHSDGTAGKAITTYQGSFGPGASSFTEVQPRSLPSPRQIERENLRSNGVDLTIDDEIASPITSSSDDFDSSKVQNMSTNYPFSASTFLEALGNFAAQPTLGSASEFPCMVSPPYYCWCPPGASSTLQRLAEQSQLPTSSNELSSLLLPPFSSLIPTTMPSNFLSPAPTLGLADAPPSMDFPALLPDPLFRFPVSASQQIPTFTPLICDPIVHVPVIDICSSGQGYFVSAGSTISSTIPPMHPMIPETDSVVEKNARETLRLLISSSTQSNPPLMDVLPAVLSNADPSQNILVAGSRGFYSGTRDVGIIANSIAAMGLVSLSGRSSLRRCSSRDQLDVLPELPSDLESLCPDDGDGSFSLSGSREKKSD